jgi:DNA polymerase III delta prime subunit
VKGDPIPDEDHVTRFCQRSRISKNGIPQATAFMLRENEIGLSVNWLEIFALSNRQEEINRIRQVYATYMKKIRPDEKITVLNVGTFKRKVQQETEDNRALMVISDPTNLNDPIDSHCEILNMRPNQEIIAELIRETILEIYPAKI